MHAAPVQRKILSTRRIMVPPTTLCAYMKKGPNLRWSLIQCSGGDEGDRTPDLLTASQALSQLSYAPPCEEVRGTPPPMQGQFRKIFRRRGRGAQPGRGRGRETGLEARESAPARGGAPRGRRRYRRPPLRRPWDISSPADRRFFASATRAPPSANGHPAGARPIIGTNSAPAHPAISKPCRFTGPGRGTPEHAAIGKIKPAGRRLANSVKCRVWTACPGPAP